MDVKHRKRVAKSLRQVKPDSCSVPISFTCEVVYAEDFGGLRALRERQAHL